MTEEIGPEAHEAVQELGEHHGGHGHAAPTKTKFQVKAAGILVVLLVVLLAITSNQASDFETHSMQTSIEKNDSWLQWTDKSIKSASWETANFVVKSIRGTVTVDSLKVTHDIGEIVGHELTFEQKQQIAAAVNRAANEAVDTRVESASKEAEGKMQYYEGKKGKIEHEAAEQTKASKEELEQHERFKKAATYIQISVALLAAVVIFANIGWLCSLMFFGGLGLALTGATVAATAAGWITIPHVLAPYLVSLGIG